jgi:hypothetical protein
MNTSITNPRSTNNTSDRDPNLIHLVPIQAVSDGSMIAFCGFDCSDRRQKEPGAANCVVCLDMGYDATRLA